jgi:hypothetical protein
VSRPRFLADHDLNDNIVDGLLRRLPQVEFIRVRDVGLASSPDPLVLDFAAVNGYLVVSHDVNTMTGHAYARIAAGTLMTGLLMVRQMDPVGHAIESLALIWTTSEAEEWLGQVVYLPL